MDMLKMLALILVSVIFLAAAAVCGMWGYLLLETIFFSLSLGWAIVCLLIFIILALSDRIY